MAKLKAKDFADKIHRAYGGNYLWERNSQKRFGWDTKVSAGTRGGRSVIGYRSWVKAPRGPGARTGTATRWYEVTRLSVWHTTVSQARQRALKMYAQEIGMYDKPERKTRYECGECGKRNAFYEGDYICQVCRDARG